MSVVLSSAVSSAGEHEGVSLKNAQIGYDTFTRTATITTSSEQPDFPASALANALSYDYWKPNIGLAGAAYASKSADVSSEVSTPGGVFFKDDGTKMYVAEFRIGFPTTSAIFQYTLSTAWDSSTASYDSVSLDTSSQSTLTNNFFIDSSGSRLFVIGGDVSNKYVFRYEMSTPWDLSTATYQSDSFQVDGVAVAFSQDGAAMFILSSNQIEQYSMTTPWDLSTASSSGKSLSLESESSGVISIFFSSGNTLYAVDSDAQCFLYTSETDWEINRFSYSETSFDASSEMDGASGIFVDEGQSVFYIFSNAVDDTVFQYSLNDEATASFSSGSPQDVNYCGIAHHNFGSAGSTVYVEYSTDNGSSWTEALSASPSDNTPILMLFESVSAADWRIRVTGSTSFRIASVYLGEALGMQRSIYGGHSPITLSRNTTIRPNKAEGGGWLGRSILRKGFSGSFSWSHLKAAWYRANFYPFVESARKYPFFIAWKPQDYPDEVAYVWTNDDIAPSNMGTLDYMEVSMNVEGLYELES